jgi:tetratricopeptide (TPR) repeat protein
MVFGGETAESYYDEGLTASMQGNLPRAVEYFQQAVKLNPNYIAAWHQLGKCYLRLGDAQTATRVLLHVIQAKPNQPAAYLDLGYAYLQLGKIVEARQQFKTAEALRAGDPKALLGLAQCAFAEGQWQESLLAAQALANTQRDNFAVHFLIGRAAWILGQTQVAMEALQRAEKLLKQSLETNPEQPEPYFLQGDIYHLTGNVREALRSYETALRYATKNRGYSYYGVHFSYADILGKCGVCCQKLGLHQDAQRYGRSLLELDPNSKLGQALIQKTPPEK